jgi:hypothetical protein
MRAKEAGVPSGRTTVPATETGCALKLPTISNAKSQSLILATALILVRQCLIIAAGVMRDERASHRAMPS